MDRIDTRRRVEQMDDARAGTERRVSYRRLIKLARRGARVTLDEIRHSLEKKVFLRRFQIARAEFHHAVTASGLPTIWRGGYRTAYVIGLFGTGRHYVNELIAANLGKRAIYLTEGIRCHPAATALIYSQHATIKYTRMLQGPPDVTDRMLRSVRSGFADLIFIYRHPLDSVLTNWVWLRTYLRHRSRGWGEDILMAYRGTEDLCADLAQNFDEFKAFADGDSSFSAAEPGPRFLSFAEYVEETALYIERATLCLRLEDFMIDPSREFSKLLRVMSIDLDASDLQLPRPRTELFRYKKVAERVPEFQAFIDQLSVETRQRIERMGYPLSDKDGASIH
jgi:hypothetical protein